MEQPDADQQMYRLSNLGTHFVCQLECDWNVKLYFIYMIW